MTLSENIDDNEYFEEGGGEEMVKMCRDYPQNLYVSVHS